ncbi:MAG: phosphate ABC transporter ATP-binding protein PstB [Bdellovibrionaceae bacterium]|nr:phosphate ABC transporter ATP-binding protein PstB [Pseudobdellovibrionaceae bacterium]MDW8190290.1 phosphate ABC transporter ATP-binding protein PstB [Pseudobdellovibrionaceae bacterium]
MNQNPVKAEIKNFSFFYRDKKAVSNVSFPLYERQVTALIGPSGCGKSTLLRSFNRMHDLYKGHRTEGEIRLMPDNINLLDPKYEATFIRMRIGMVFQKPNPFPKTIFENVVYGLKIRGIKKRSVLEEKCERALRQAGLWDEVKDRLKQSALSLSGGQQQRLCIARALAVGPEILLLDEPTSALDPISTSRIENLLSDLKKDVTILIVTHNLQQAARVSEFTAFMYLGELIEFNETRIIFTNPKNLQTEKYVTGHFG